MNIQDVLDNNEALAVITSHGSLISKAKEAFEKSSEANRLWAEARKRAQAVVSAGRKKVKKADNLRLSAIRKAYELPEVKRAMQAFAGHPELADDRKALCDAIELAAYEEVEGEVLLLKSEAGDLKDQAECLLLDSEELQTKGDEHANEGRALFDEANTLAEEHGLQHNNKK